MKKLAALAALALLSACATTTPSGPSGPFMQWRCDGGAAFSARITGTGTAEVFAAGQTYSLPHVQAASGAKYSNGSVEYWEHGGEATLGGARGGPYNNCRRG
ncbi:MAG: MliC family protein [Caulobacteraceae bacterium]|jgi:membrane-bound inhibitor of C-type lysozyme|nr:MliC family protein [Caulobacteraceae bacterium]MBK8543306.1 MliC family protein [Caulobacteraceae bacterium]MBP6690555.1 MliC family protein [Hyphomonadaceae bacterium]